MTYAVSFSGTYKGIFQTNLPIATRVTLSVDNLYAFRLLVASLNWKMVDYEVKCNSIWLMFDMRVGADLEICIFKHKLISITRYTLCCGKGYRFEHCILG